MSVYAALAVAFLIWCGAMTVLAVCGFLNQHIDDAIRRVDSDRSRS